MKNNFSRRNFLKTAALSSTAVAIPGCVNATPAHEDNSFKLNENPLKIGVMTYNIAKKWGIETVVKNLTEAEFQSVELRTTHGHGIEVTMSAAERAEVKKRFEDSPLEAISLASAFKYHYTDPAELKKALKVPRNIRFWLVMLGLLVSGFFLMSFPRRCRKNKPWRK